LQFFVIVVDAAIQDIQTVWIPAIAPILNPSPFTGEGSVEQFAARIGC
jgi:hypothetical protein